jgi:hypothetical protein
VVVAYPLGSNGHSRDNEAEALQAKVPTKDEARWNRHQHQNGVRSLAVYWWQCHHETIINADHWPGDLTLPSFGPRMVCTKCGISGTDVRPNWRELGA